jgi:hypothetical protein
MAEETYLNHLLYMTDREEYDADDDVEIEYELERMAPMSEFTITASARGNSVLLAPNDCRKTWEAPTAKEALAIAVLEQESWACEQLACKREEVVYEIEEEFI